ncbi:MAG: class I SAM-dependent methyltransferase [Acidobacteria bacterium]|nr:class I SAM-dependent methyltransferase [Acidobacteriota bacterium]MCA1638670.1 class I SAM-dependent methyltransferase [Acidobacteriota bacterium]
MEDLGHSELFFSDYRDYWYNKDFLDLMAKRWDLGRYSTLLDIGCGLCHWSQLLTPYLKPNSTVTAYDNDIKWAAGNEGLKVRFKSLQSSLNFVKGDAHRLIFEDDSFDVVTCQTLLIHLENPKQALLEMKRVVKKGGIVICAEPNNLVGNLIKDSVSKDETLLEKLENIKFSILWEQGKIKLKEGDNSFGDLLTGTMSEAGFLNLQSYVSDKVVPLYPPYSKAEQKATIESMKLWQKERKTFDKTGRKYFEVLGAEAIKFYEDFIIKRAGNKVLTQIEMNEYYSGGATIMYLVSGSK